jgi:hypothetical protein
VTLSFTFEVNALFTDGLHLKVPTDTGGLDVRVELKPEIGLCTGTAADERIILAPKTAARPSTGLQFDGLNKVTEVGCKWLNRRSQRASMTWPRMHQLLERYPLPRPHITHPLLPRAASP